MVSHPEEVAELIEKAAASVATITASCSAQGSGGGRQPDAADALAKLSLPKSDADHRRVLAVIKFLEAR
jgi:hypothetical protein